MYLVSGIGVFSYEYGDLGPVRCIANGTEPAIFLFLLVLSLVYYPGFALFESPYTLNGLNSPSGQQPDHLTFLPRPVEGPLSPAIPATSSTRQQRDTVLRSL